MKNKQFFFAVAAYCVIVFATAILAFNFLSETAGWFVTVGAGLLLSIVFYRFFYFPARGYSLKNGFQELLPAEQVAGFFLFPGVPLLAFTAAVMSLEQILFPTAFVLAMIILSIGKSVIIRSRYTYSNINEMNAPVIEIYYSRMKIGLRLTFMLVFCITMSVLLVMGLMRSGINWVLFLSIPLMGLFVWYCMLDVRRLRHKDAVLRVNQMYLSYEAPGKSWSSHWEHIAGFGYETDEYNKMLTVTTTNEGIVRLDIKSLEYEPMKIVDILSLYHTDFVKDIRDKGPLEWW